MLKIILSFFLDPDTWIGGTGMALVFIVPSFDKVMLALKLLSVILGICLVSLSIYHKILQIKNEKKNNGTSKGG